MLSVEVAQSEKLVLLIADAPKAFQKPAKRCNSSNSAAPPDGTYLKHLT